MIAWGLSLAAVVVVGSVAWERATRVERLPGVRIQVWRAER